MFSDLSKDQFFPNSTAHVFNAGAPVWGIDWCPIHGDSRAGEELHQLVYTP